MEVVGLVPARTGSKGVAGKNLAPLAGRPLIVHTIEAARASRHVGRTVVSTDSQQIAEVAMTAGAEVPLLRPEHLGRDDTPMADVVVHALETMVPECDVLVLLQPTSPLRSSRHIDEAVELLLHRDARAVVSVTEVPHRFSPGSLMRLEGGQLVALDDDAPTLRQDKPRLYARNGPALLVLRRDAVRRGASLYAADPLPYPMDARSSLDVDDELDLEIAELLLARQRR